jgi:N-methylhydantoinase B/oxoprolinase/acetone carboxylase alpha subunit
VITPGKLMRQTTAAMGFTAFLPAVIDCIIKALEPTLPERSPARFRTFSSLSYSGKPDTGAVFKANDSGHGGWGACATHDGAGPFRTMAHGDTRLIPIELQESMYPYRVEEFRLRQDSGGPGMWRGGLGFDKQYILLAPCELWANFDRIGCPPWGVQGAKAGKSGQVLIFKNGKTEPELLYKTENCPLQTGDRVRMSTGGGGGYGDPRLRPVELVRRDVIRGFVSRDSARDDYGVLFDDNGSARRVSSSGSDFVNRTSTRTRNELETGVGCPTQSPLTSAELLPTWSLSIMKRNGSFTPRAQPPMTISCAAFWNAARRPRSSLKKQRW